MQLGALSRVINFRSHLVSWIICLLATTIWNILHPNLTSFIWSIIYFDSSYNPMKHRWKHRLLDGVCTAIATTTTASVAHILRYYSSSRTGLLGAVSFGAFSNSCMITCIIILCRTFLGISYLDRMKPASESIKYGSQILYVILCTNNWFFIHEVLAQANNNDIEVTLILEFLCFNGCLAGFALLVDWPSSNIYENHGVYFSGLKEE